MKSTILSMTNGSNHVFFMAKMDKLVIFVALMGAAILDFYFSNFMAVKLSKPNIFPSSYSYSILMDILLRFQLFYHVKSVQKVKIK